MLFMVAERYEARRKEQQGTDRGSWMEREIVEREREGPSSTSYT